MIPLSQSLKRQNREGGINVVIVAMVIGTGAHRLALIIPEVCTRLWTVKKNEKKKRSGTLDLPTSKTGGSEGNFL